MAKRAFPGNAAGPTWLDWLPPGDALPADDDLITRADLLQRLAAYEVMVCSRTLEYMEHQGIVPRPVRRWHDGATRALYPPWMVDLVLRAFHAKWARDRQPLSAAERHEAVRQAIARPLIATMRAEYV